MEQLKLHKKGNIKYYTIPSFEETGLITAAFTTRLGGVSEEPYNSLNLGLHVEDKPEWVIENRKRIADTLGFSIEQMVCAQQVHGSRVAVVDKSHRGLGTKEYSAAIPDTDALVTNEAGVVLVTYYADCVPLFIFDPAKRVIALAHAGWKGTVAEIGRKALESMEEQFACRVQNCLVAIGPSIGPCCYEVDQRLVKEFSNNFPFAPSLFKESGEGKWKLDLWEANRRQFLLAGVPEGNITNPKICTSCNNNLLFSHRADGGRTGRLAAILTIK